MRYPTIINTLLLFLLAAPVAAQDVSTDSTTTVTEESDTSITTDVDVTTDSEAEVNILIDQEVADEELTVDVEAELQQRLHSLDRKLTACAEIGNEECVTRVESMIDTAQERAEKYIERREELGETIKARFEEWRASRQEHIDTMKERVQKRRDRRAELQ